MMEVALSVPPTLYEPNNRGTPLPPCQLVEESQSRASVPIHPLKMNIYAKLKSNTLIQAEPLELHFSGFELGKDYIKILKLINVSSEVMNIHIIPTQTKHFQTSYTKKYRLIPGLAYTLKVRFCPDEWRYFYDCIQVHCKGDEKLLIPVHAYPVIGDLHIPPCIDLPDVPLGKSICHAIPLRCSCPIDFGFQVNVIESHEAFSVHPLAGVIPANGEVKIIVKFTPSHYETSQVTIQLTISQFNTKPHLCTITGSATPHLARSELVRNWDHEEAASAKPKRPSAATKVPFQIKAKHRTRKEAIKSKFVQMSIQPGLKLLLDVSTPAGVAKMLIQDTSKVTSKDLREAMSCGNTGLQDRRMKEALFLKKIQQNVREEQANHIRWQGHLGKDPVSQHTRRQVAEEREIALHEYMLKRGDVIPEENLAARRPKLSSQRVLCEAGQACEEVPSFQFYPSFQWDLRQRSLKLFQQAARKVVMRCRMNRRLSCLKELSDSMKNLPPAEKVKEEKWVSKIAPNRIFPFAFPIFPDQDDPLALSNLGTVSVEPLDVTVTSNVPFFKLQVPQHYKLMGFKPVSAWEAFTSYIPNALARPLRISALDELAPKENELSLTMATLKVCEKQQYVMEEEEEEANKAESLTFTAPEALLRPPLANPLRIFNPTPGLQTYKLTPKYLESDLEFHLCPLARYAVPEGDMNGTKTQTQKFLDHKEMIAGIMTWKNFDLITLTCLSKQPALVGDFALCRSLDYCSDTLPPIAPPPLTCPPDDLPSIMDQLYEVAVQLTPEMVKAQFLCGEALVSNSNRTRGATARHQEEIQIEATYRSELNQMGKRVMAKLKRIGVTNRPSRSLAEDCEDAKHPLPTQQTPPEMHKNVKSLCSNTLSHT